MSAILAYLHALSMIGLGASLVSQLLILHTLRDHDDLRRFLQFSAGFVIAAVCLPVTGLMLLGWSGRGAAFYLHNPVFYIKLSIVVAMALIAITPARMLLSWHRGGGMLPDAGEVVLVARYLRVELVLMCIVPLTAALAARGIGSQS